MKHSYTFPELRSKTDEIRRDVIRMIEKAGSGHPAGALGMAEVFTALYFVALTHDPKHPLWEERDRVVLSNGHICPALYAAMAHAGYFSHQELFTLRTLGSRLQGHPSRVHLPGIEVSTGSLGQGLSVAAGMALAAQMDQKHWRVYCVMGDGEQQEGQIWEAAMFAGNRRLHNLVAILDRNNIQTDGFTEDVLALEPLRQKYEAFGWYVIEVDGHNLEEIVDAFEKSKAVFEKPKLIIAHTIPGKGVDFMERSPQWHSHAIDPKTARQALHDLRTLRGRIVPD